MSKDEPELPADITKEVVKKPGFSAKIPKKGDEVKIRYTGSTQQQGGAGDNADLVFDRTAGNSPVSFTLGVGAVMEAWDRALATMKEGEVAKFTFPEMYLNGGPASYTEKIPDCDAATYELELVAVTTITDLFKDGGVVQKIVNDGEQYGRPPKVGDELIISYELGVDGAEGPPLDSRPAMEYKIGIGGEANLIQRKVLDAALLTMKKDGVAELIAKPDYAFGSAWCPELNIPCNSKIRVKLKIMEVCEVEDAGKKASWPDGIVMKKAIHVVRSRLVPGMDGTWCKARLLKAAQEKRTLLEDTLLEFMPGRGELCDALEVACARMRKGEIAQVTVRGPADLHCPGKPDLDGTALKADVPVVYHLEMIEFDNPPPEDGPPGERERILFCRTQKDRGSSHFKEGRIRLAQERYARVLQLLPLYKREGSSSLHVDFFADERCKEEAEELRRSCRLNLAACALKMEEFYRAKQVCGEVLEADPSNLKALYRRAQALLGTKDYEEAAADCKQMLKIEVNNIDARSLFQKIQKAKKEEDQRQRELLAGKMQKF
mmetsp:Transcript_31786/g.74232  ORF Transcript_31786/g.74232 Transcript_31786/m.74232 type:complete len:547 (+) Transcript_31786:67-1707(+)